MLRKCGAVTEVPAEDYLAAAPDPLAAAERPALQHLDVAHPRGAGDAPAGCQGRPEPVTAADQLEAAVHRLLCAARRGCPER